MGNAQRGLSGVALRGGAAAGVAQLVKLLVQFGSVVVLARLLEPSDFGMMAALSPLFAFVAMFQDIGLKEALYQRDDVSDELVNQIFYATLWLGLACAGVVAASSPLVAWFYGEPRLAAMTLLSSLSVLLSSWATVPTALLNRRLAFGTIAGIDIAASLLGFAATLTGALLGAGYWSLLYSPLVSTVVILVVTWARAGFRPGPRPATLIDRSALTFGANLTGFNFLNFFSRNIDNVLIGRVFGSVQLGFYDRAYKLLLFPLQTVNAPLSRVMVPLLSRLQHEPERFRRAFVRTAGQLGLVTVTGTAAVIPVSHELTTLLFGERWQPVAPIFAWLGLAGLVQPINSAVGWVFIAQGRTDVLLRWSAYSSLTTVASFVVGLQWDTTAVAAAYALSGYLFRVPQYYFVVASVGPITKRDLAAIQGPMLVAAGLTFLTVTYLLRPLGLGGYTLLALSCSCSAIATPLCMAVLPEGREVLRESVGLVQRVIGARRVAGDNGGVASR
ncbi:MAG: lipopolysaccharide biosynthesis protein [Polyangiales bacterium]